MDTEHEFKPEWRLSPAQKAMSVLYPRPGTMAARILDFIRENPGSTINSIIVELDSNASPTRVCIRNLIGRGKIRCEHQDNGGTCPMALPKKAAAKLREQTGQSEHRFTAGKVY